MFICVIPALKEIISTTRPEGWVTREGYLVLLSGSRAAPMRISESEAKGNVQIDTCCALAIRSLSSSDSLKNFIQLFKM